MPGLARCIEALQASELSRIHKEQFKETFDSPNTVHAAEKYHSVKERRKGNSGSSDGNLRGRNKSGKEKPLFYASFVAPSIRMIEPNVLRLVKPVTNVVNKATLL